MELFHGRRVRSFLPTLDDTVDVEAGKAARERRDLVTKCEKQSTNPLPPLKKGDMCYRIKLDGKRETLIHNPCEVVQIRNHGESYYIRDLETGRIYLSNRKFVKHSETSRNLEHHLKNMEVVSDKTLKHKLQDWTLSTETIVPPDSCVQDRNLETLSKRVKFDSTLFLAMVNLRRWRSAPTS